MKTLSKQIWKSEYNFLVYDLNFDEWYTLSRHPDLNKTFIQEIVEDQEVSEFLDWKQISRNPYLDENFIKKYSEKLNFYSMSIFNEKVIRKLSKDFIIENGKRFCLSMIREYRPDVIDYIKFIKQLKIE